MVYWIDEVLINSGWDHATEWKQHILEWDIYQERLRADRFYEIAHEAETLAGTDPLETFFLCVALGFRGRYVDRPKELEAWAERVYNRIVAGSHQPDKFMPDDSGRNAPLQPLAGKSVLLACLVARLGDGPGDAGLLRLGDPAVGMITAQSGGTAVSTYFSQIAELEIRGRER